MVPSSGRNRATREFFVTMTDGEANNCAARGPAAAAKEQLFNR